MAKALADLVGFTVTDKQNDIADVEKIVASIDAAKNLKLDTEFSQGETQPDIRPGSAKLLLDENFDGTSFWGKKWSYCPEWERGGGYSVWDKSMATLDGEGHLVLRAEWDEENNRVKCGGVRTVVPMGLFGSTTYGYGLGYYEASMKVPKAYGIWGAFWLMCGDVSNIDGSAADGVEIDIIETVYKKVGAHINSAMYWDGYGNETQKLWQGYPLADYKIFDGNFHTFALERAKDAYIYYIDGKEVWRVTSDLCDICTKDGYLKLTLEGAEWSGAGTRESIADLPAEMIVDYVRVYDANPYK